LKAITILCLVIAINVSGCAARDFYRNRLCASSGGAQIYVTVDAWRTQYDEEIAQISAVSPSKAYLALGPTESRTQLNTRFVEEVRFRSAGPGITEHDFRLVDFKTGVVLAKWIRFYTGNAASAKSPFPSLVKMSDSCFDGSREYLKMRQELQEIGR
jgi:hypothetical protein